MVFGECIQGSYAGILVSVVDVRVPLMNRNDHMIHSLNSLKGVM